MKLPAAYPRYPDHPSHRWFGDGAIQALNGKYRACILGPFGFGPFKVGHRDLDTFKQAVDELTKMHCRLFERVVWC